MDNKKVSSGPATAASKASTSQPPAGNPPITKPEKKWLKDNYKDEFHFLREQGLSIYKDEDRAEGRLIMRAFMEEDEGDDDDEEGNDSGDSFLRELEEDPMSHVADYAFSAEQLAWIKKYYKHSGNFLLSYGLKPFDDGDCRGRQIDCSGYDE